MNQGFQSGQELNALPLTAEVVKVGLPVIAESLQRSLGDQDWQELWKRLLIEATTTANRRKAAPTSPKQEGSLLEAVNEEERLRLDRQTLTIALDETPHVLTDPKAFSVSKAIAVSPAERHLQILPGGIGCKDATGEDVSIQIGGKTLAIIRELIDAYQEQLDWTKLSQRIWGADAYTDKATIKNAVADARDALRKLARKAGMHVTKNYDPLPCVNRGKDLAWKLDF